jgi:hypothetical protein
MSAMPERDHTEQLYVATDASGVENALASPVQWALPAEGAVTTAPSGHLLVLRTALGLLEMLDEVIYRVDPMTEVVPSAEGSVHVASARLISKANWDTEVATRFALACAEHILGAAADLTLPDGTALGAIIADARVMLDGLAPDAPEHLGYLARLSALRRLHRERAELGEISLAVLGEDEAKDLTALDDPAYMTVIPITDAVLAATEALRHHLLPKFDADDEARVEERAQHEVVDGPKELRIPSTIVTPFGSAMVGGSRMPAYDPAWVGARAAARHARMAALDKSGKAAEDLERNWQASTLSTLLEER